MSLTPPPTVRGFAWELCNVKVHKVLFSRDFSVAISIVKHTLSVNMIPNPILVDKTKKHWQYQQNPIYRVGEPRQKLKANLRCFYAIAWSVERRSHSNAPGAFPHQIRLFLCWGRPLGLLGGDKFGYKYLRFAFDFY